MDSQNPRSRRSFLLSGSVGAVAGAAGVASAKAPGWRWTPKPEVPQPPQVELNPEGLSHETNDRIIQQLPKGTTFSFSQFGEDLVANSLFSNLKILKPSYLDIGAYEPVYSNNTYFFYRREARGVLIEPNVALTEKLKRVRPRDTVLPIGIGISDATEADYYVMTEDQWNTFDKDEAERRARETNHKIVKVVKLPLVNINRVIADHFAGAAPDLLSIDIEGLEFAVLKTLDFKRYRPKIICAETLVTATLTHKQDTAKFLASHGYELRGLTFANSLFIDQQLLK